MYKRIFLTCLTVLMVLMPFARGGIPVWSVAVFQATVFFLGFVWLCRKDWKKICPDAADILVACFLSLAATSVLFSLYKYDSVNAFLMLLAYALLYYMTLSAYDRGFRRYVIGLSVFVAVALSLYGLLKYIGMAGPAQWPKGEFLSSAYGSHNHFSGYLELVIPVTLGLLIRKRKNGFAAPTALFISLIILISVFILAQSRGAWVSLGISLVMMLLFLISHRKPAYIILPALVVIFSISVLVFYPKKQAIVERFLSIGNALDGKTTMATRTTLWRGAAAMAAGHPVIGVGTGCFDRAYSRYRPLSFYRRAQFAHNDYIQAAAEMGMAAPLVIAVFLFLLIRTGVRMSRHPVMLGMLAGVVSLSLHGLVDFNFHMPANMVLFLLYAAIIRGESMLVAGRP